VVSVRSFLAVLTTLATVVHFTVGCHAHAGHDHAVEVCPGTVAAGACDEAHDDRHDDAPMPATADDRTVTSGDAVSHTAEPGCYGCDCAATCDAKPAGPMLADHLGVAWKAESIELIASVTRGPWEVADSPVLSELEPRLFERLLV